MSEKFTFHKLFGNSPAVDGNIIALFAAVFMNGFCNQVFSAAGFSQYDDIHIVFRSFHNEFINILHGFASADNASQAVRLLYRGFELFIFFLQFQFIEFFFGNIHDYSLVTDDISLLVIIARTDVPNPFQKPARKFYAVFHFIGLMLPYLVIAVIMGSFYIVLRH